MSPWRKSYRLITSRYRVRYQKRLWEHTPELVQILLNLTHGVTIGLSAMAWCTASGYPAARLSGITTDISNQAHSSETVDHPQQVDRDVVHGTRSTQMF